jgi:hypothetical protein
LQDEKKQLGAEQKKALADGLSVLLTSGFNPRLYEGADEEKRMLVVPDPHPGNLKLVWQGGKWRLAVLDWGQHGELRPSESRELLRLLTVLAVESVVTVPVLNRTVRVADMPIVNSLAKRLENRSSIVRVFSQYVRRENLGSETPEQFVESLLKKALTKPPVVELLAARFSTAKIRELLPFGYDPSEREGLVEKLSRLVPDVEPGSAEAKRAINALIDKEWMLEDAIDAIDAFFASALAELSLPQGYLDAGKMMLYTKLVEDSFELGPVRDHAFMGIYKDYKTGQVGSAVVAKAQQVISWLDAAMNAPLRG